MTNESEIPNDVEPDDEREGRSIRVASRITGISVDTLRMWERRYGFPNPCRNDNGNRLYSRADVNRLALVAKAISNGYRAGEAIRLDTETLRTRLARQEQKQRASPLDLRDEIEQLVNRISQNDFDGLQRELRRLAGSLGGKSYVTNVVAPLVEAVGEGWAQGRLCIYQERLMTEVVSTELRLAGNLLDNPFGPKVLFATLPREQHGLGLQMVALYARLLGAQGRVLGTETPILEIARAATALRVQAVAISVSRSAPSTAVIDHVSGLAEHLPTSVECWLGGKGALSLEPLPPRARLLPNWEALEFAVGGLLHER
jgi:DNA-binding transcriptional MerR regulator